jgi:hypothetical protein
MPITQANAASANVNGKLYVVGGLEVSGVIDNPRTGLLQVYDPASNTWIIKSPMPTARSGAAAVAISGKLYVVGGEPTGSIFTNALEVYDPQTDTWSAGTPMPTVRGNLNAATLNGLIYVVGGYAPGVGFALNEVYDPATDSWHSDAPMPTARIGFAAVPVNGAIYTMGGATAYPFEILPVSEAFHPTPAPTPSYTAVIQPPIDASGSSVFNAKRGVVPTKFKLLVEGSPTCSLPPASISLFRLSGGTTAPVNESDYVQPSDTGASFRIDAATCQYIYNLGSSSLGPALYRVEITVNGAAVGAAVFGLK